MTYLRLRFFIENSFGGNLLVELLCLSCALGEFCLSSFSVSSSRPYVEEYFVLTWLRFSSAEDDSACSNCGRGFKAIGFLLGAICWLSPTRSIAFLSASQRLRKE